VDEGLGCLGEASQVLSLGWGELLHLGRG
jgi:hypothetical protein